MRRMALSSVFLLSMVLTGSMYAAEPYEIDRAHSSVEFAVSHMVLSKTKGEFNDFSGTVMLDDNDITKSSVEVTINTASIDTDDEKRDGHLKSADFFNVEKYPTITFKSKKIEKTMDGLAVVGDLTIRDVTKEVTIPFTMKGPISAMGSKRFGAEGNLTINRQDYGVSWSRTLDNGGLVVGNDVDIMLQIEAVHSAEMTNK